MKINLFTLILVAVIAFELGWLTCGVMHDCPLPSVEYVQIELNKAGEDLVVDGVPGSKTVTAWAFRSTGWESQNERKLLKN